MTILAQDHAIETPAGRIAARSLSGEDAVQTGKTPLPLLLLHDSLGCMALWRSFPEALAKASRRRVVIWDRPGHGESDTLREPQGFDFIAKEGAEVIPALCEALGIEDFILVGHSVGGGMAIETAARFPERCKAVITIAAQAFVEDLTVTGVAEAKTAFQAPGAVERLAKYHGDKARAVLEAWTETWLDPAYGGWSLDEALAKVRCPVLALHGELDEFGTAAHPERIAANGRGEVRILPGLGHVPHKEDEALMTGILVDFLEKIAAP